MMKTVKVTNAANKAAGIADTHYHGYKYGPGYGKEGFEYLEHIPGEYKP
jgi:hypothetical protein